MARYPELEALDGITNYWDLEQHIFDAVGVAVRSAQSYTVPHFLTVGYWKARRQIARYLTNTGEALEAVTRHALADKPPEEGRRRRLMALAGVRAPVASALLTVWHPDEHTIIDVWALSTLAKLGEAVDGVAFGTHGQPWWEQRYELYLKGCLAIAQRVHPLSLRDVDRALWKWGQMSS